jgi:hypothetical protein
VHEPTARALAYAPPVRAIPALVLTAWALLLAAWVLGNAPFAAPDEAAHYVRAVGIGRGQLIGRADPDARIGITATQIAWTDQAARAVSLPQGLDPQPFSCELGPGERSAACLRGADQRPPAVTRITAVGNYQPLPYVLPAIALRAAGSAPAALRLGRAATALTVLALLAIALFAVFDSASPSLSVLGLLLAVTPMTLFCGATLSGSGTEIAGAVAFFACLLRLARPTTVPARWWALAALSGATLALSRSASPAWLVLLTLIAGAWSGARPFARRWLSGRAPRLAAGALVLALALNRAWEARYGSHVPLDTSSLLAGLDAGAREWWRAVPELIGKFGYLDVKLPLVIPVVWLALIAALVAVALPPSPARERRLLAAVVAIGLAAPIAFYALIIRPTGFGLQGRHVLPLLIAVPLLAGEMLNRHRERADARAVRLLTTATAVAVALIQGGSWYINAKRYAVGGSGPAWFLSHPDWVPPLGWWAWLAATMLAGACLAAIAVLQLGASANSSARAGVSV